MRLVLTWLQLAWADRPSNNTCTNTNAVFRQTTNYPGQAAHLDCTKLCTTGNTRLFQTPAVPLRPKHSSNDTITDK